VAAVTVDRDEHDAARAEMVRLREDLAEVRQQLRATSEVLTAIGRSASDVDAVLGTVVDSARRLCRADVAQIHLVEGEVLRLVRSSGLSDAGVEFMARHPVGSDRRSLIGRVLLYGRTQQITDVLSDPDYARADLQRLAGLRTVLGVPMQLDHDLVGVLVVWRTEVDPFGDRETEVLTTFAAQAAIAIRQADLVRALQSRQCLSGRMQGRLRPLEKWQEDRMKSMGFADKNKVYGTEELAAGKDIIFCATGVTDGDLLRGVRFFGGGIRTSSLFMSQKTNTIRFVDTIYREEGSNLAVSFV
jgi:transcriptional regulator with GAF, ATPase, and Fis domain